MGFLLRWVFALALLVATYNPTGFSYVSWAEENFTEQMPLVVLFGLILLVGYIIYLRATFRSIGIIGMGLIVALAAALIWVMIDFGLLSLENSAFRTWLGILALSLVLGTGLSWSIVRRRLSGQADVDDVDE